MDTATQLKADVVAINVVNHEKSHMDADIVDKEDYQLEEGAKSQGEDFTALPRVHERKLTTKQEWIVFSACCISLFRKYQNDCFSWQALQLIVA
jgi:hypothetical protein